MEGVNKIPAHALLERKGKADNHSTRKTQSATQSFFSSFGFDTASPTSETAQKKKAGEAALQHNPLKHHSLSMITTLQGVEQQAGEAAPGNGTKA